MSTHETDFYSWTQEQATLLRQGRLNELDCANLIEEIEDMGWSEKRELINRLAVLLAHLLKWQYQPERPGNSWRFTVETQRKLTRKVLRENPSMKPLASESLTDAYDDARLIAMKETHLDPDTFPPACPWSLEQTLDNEFWPES
ncbi:DUF29 domain-containing protein [Gammaproteobacteria bacterium]